MWADVFFSVIFSLHELVYFVDAGTDEVIDWQKGFVDRNDYFNGQKICYYYSLGGQYLHSTVAHTHTHALTNQRSFFILDLNVSNLNFKKGTK